MRAIVIIIIIATAASANETTTTITTTTHHPHHHHHHHPLIVVWFQRHVDLTSDWTSKLEDFCGISVAIPRPIDANGLVCMHRKPCHRRLHYRHDDNQYNDTPRFQEIDISTSSGGASGGNGARGSDGAAGSAVAKVPKWLQLGKK